MMHIPRHVDAEVVHSLEHEILLCAQQVTALSHNKAEHSRGRVHAEVHMATTEYQPLKSSVYHNSRFLRQLSKGHFQSHQCRSVQQCARYLKDRTSNFRYKYFPSWSRM